MKVEVASIDILSDEIQMVYGCERILEVLRRRRKEQVFIISEKGSLEIVASCCFCSLYTNQKVALQLVSMAHNYFSC